MGFFDRLFAPADATEPLSGGQKSRALIDTGLGILAANGRPGSNAFSALAEGVMGGRAGVQAGIEANRTAQGRQAISDTQLGEDPEEQYKALTQLLPQLLGRGDLEGAKWVTQALNSLSPIVAARQRATATTNKPILRNVGGSLVQVTTDENGNEQIEELYKGGPNGVTPYQNMVQDERLYQRGAAIVREFDNDTEKDFALASKIRGTLGSVAVAKAGNGAAQVDMLYSFITALDPNSAVREGEIKLAQEASSLWARAKAEVMKKTKDASYIVPPELVDQMAEIMRRRYALLQDSFNSKRDSAIRQAKTGKVDEQVSGVLRTLPSLNAERKPLGTIFTPKGATK